MGRNTNHRHSGKFWYLCFILGGLWKRHRATRTVHRLLRLVQVPGMQYLTALIIYTINALFQSDINSICISDFSPDSYERAHKYLKRAEDTSDLQTEDERVEKKRKKM